MIIHTVTFTEWEASFIFSLPRVPAKLDSLLRCYIYFSHEDPPEYEVIHECFSKLRSCGIVTHRDGLFTVEDNWYAMIHGTAPNADDNSELSLQFEKAFVGKQWPVLWDSTVPFTEQEYSQAVADATLNLL